MMMDIHPLCFVRLLCCPRCRYPSLYQYYPCLSPHTLSHSFLTFFPEMNKVSRLLLYGLAEIT